MLNFHSYTFLDLKRYEKLINDNVYLSYYNPKFLFLWKEVFKTEVYFNGNDVYFKFKNDLGDNIYMPIHGDLNNCISNIKEEKFKIVGPIDPLDFNYYKTYNYELIENKALNFYLYKIDDFTILKKKYKTILKVYNKLNKGNYVKIIKRDDEKELISFAAYYLKEDPNYFKVLLMLKNYFEYLYELDLFGMMLYDKDNHVIGYAVASAYKSTIYIHNIIANTFDDNLFLLNNFVKTFYNNTKYLNIEEEGINIKLKNDGIISPSSIEKYYMIYNL